MKNYLFFFNSTPLKSGADDDKLWLRKVEHSVQRDDERLIRNNSLRAPGKKSGNFFIINLLTNSSHEQTHTKCSSCARCRKYLRKMFSTFLICWIKVFSRKLFYQTSQNFSNCFLVYKVCQLINCHRTLKLKTQEKLAENFQRKTFSQLSTWSAEKWLQVSTGRCEKGKLSSTNIKTSDWKISPSRFSYHEHHREGVTDNRKNFHDIICWRTCKKHKQYIKSLRLCRCGKAISLCSWPSDVILGK